MNNRIQKYFRGKITVNKAIDCASRKIGLYWLDDVKGKESITEFERISYNGKTSVVKCYPKTGRTHQIRIHLQYLGHPIVNDPLYNQPTVWGNGNGKDGIYEYSKEQIEQNFLNIHTYEAWIIKQEQMDNNHDNNEDQDSKDEDKESNEIRDKEIKIVQIEEISNSVIDQNNSNVNNLKRKNETFETNIILNPKDQEENYKKQKIEKDEITEKLTISLGRDVKDKPSFDESLLTKDDECFECKQKYRDPKRSDLTMYLHALSYKV